MRFATFILLGVFIGTGASSPSNFTDIRTPSQSSNDFPTSKLKQAIKEAKTDLETTRSNLKTQYERKPGSQQSIISGYDAKEVIRGIAKGKTALIESLSGPEFAGYRAHVRKFYPNPKLKSVGYSPEKPLVSIQSARESYARAEKYIEKIETSAARPVIDLMINSSPTTAYFEMWVNAESSRRNLTTNNPMKNISRGYYSYRVTKAGYKPIEFELDLIDGDGTEFNCTINKLDDPEGPNPCSLR
jgi:hypothetical protein